MGADICREAGLDYLFVIDILRLCYDTIMFYLAHDTVRIGIAVSKTQGMTYLVRRHCIMVYRSIIFVFVVKMNLTPQIINSIRLLHIIGVPERSHSDNI